MIYNTSYKNDKIKAEIDAKMGKPFSLWKRLKLGGIGSSRMIIEEVSVKMIPYISKVSDINYLNIELRPNGILVHITKALEKFSWTIPYYQLSIFNSDLYSIHSQGQFIKVRKDNYYNLNKNFLDKLLERKSDFLKELNIQ